MCALTFPGSSMPICSRMFMLPLNATATPTRTASSAASRSSDTLV